MLLAVSILGLTVVPLTQHAWVLLHFPFDLDPGEGLDVGAAAVLLSGSQLYGDPAQFPFFELNYPPLYALAVAPLLMPLGPSVIAGRVVSAASAMGVAALILGATSSLSRTVFPLSPTLSLRPGSGQALPLSRTVFPLSPTLSLRPGSGQALPRQRGGSLRGQEVAAPSLDGKLAGALGALAFLASGYVLHVMPLARTTSLMVFLSVAGLFCLERASKARCDLRGAGQSGQSTQGSTPAPRPSAWLAIGLIFLLAAVYTKPVALDAVEAGLGFLIVRRPVGWARGLVAAAVLGIGLHVLLQLQSNGRYADAVFTANVYAFGSQQLLSHARNFLETHGLLLAVGLSGLVFELRRGAPSPWSFYLGAGLITAATSGRWGAGESYFLPLIISSCVLGAGTIGKAELVSLPSLAVAALAVYPFLAGPGPWPISALFPGRDRGFQAEIASNPGPEDFAAGKQILDFVAAAGGEVLSEAAGFSVLAREPVVGSPMLIRGLAEHGLYDSSNLVAALRSGCIDGVVLLGFWYPQPVLDAIDAYYERVDQIEMNHDAYVLLRPRLRVTG